MNTTQATPNGAENMTQTAPKLIKVYDVRPFDWNTGKPVQVSELDPQEIPNCTRCGRKHAVVWIVQGVDGKVHSVGSSCAKKVFDGWTPDENELKLAKKADRERRKSEAEKKRQAWIDTTAQGLIESLAGTLEDSRSEDQGEFFHKISIAAMKAVRENIDRKVKIETRCKVEEQIKKHFVQRFQLTDWYGHVGVY